MSNILQFKQPVKLVDVREISGTPAGWYNVDIKTYLLNIITEIRREMSEEDFCQASDIDSKTLHLIKTVRVSQITIDQLLEVLFKLGYGFNLSPYLLSDNQK